MLQFVVLVLQHWNRGWNLRVSLRFLCFAALLVITSSLSSRWWLRNIFQKHQFNILLSPATISLYYNGCSFSLQQGRIKEASVTADFLHGGASLESRQQLLFGCRYRLPTLINPKQSLWLLQKQRQTSQEGKLEDREYVFWMMSNRYKEKVTVQCFWKSHLQLV